MPTTTPTFTILGITDDFTTCDCCGRAGLKATVALDRTDEDGNATGDVLHYGRDCAAKAVCGNNRAASVRKVVGNAETAMRNARLARESKLARIAGDRNRANYNYMTTNRPLEGSYFATRGPLVVRVDGNDRDDINFYSSEGFVK